MDTKQSQKPDGGKVFFAIQFTHAALGWGSLLLKTMPPTMLAQFQNAPLSQSNLITPIYPILSVNH